MLILINKTLHYVFSYKLSFCSLLLLFSCASTGRDNSGSCCDPFKYEDIKNALIQYVESQDDGLKDCSFKKIQESDILGIGENNNENVLKNFKHDLDRAGFSHLNSFQSYSMDTKDLCGAATDNIRFFVFIVVEGKIHFISHFNIS